MARNGKNSSDQGLEVVTVRDLEGIQTVRPIWEKMQANEPYPVINADIDRYLSVLQAAEDECRPLIMILKQNDQPRAMVYRLAGEACHPLAGGV